ncbi:MAG: single-stranded DNA-binding protein [Clostridia bacterium]|nr:single-stranded DNA-binding protein [Clostridia bacterium]
MANFNLNKVIIAGRLTADPELKQTPNGVSVTSFTVAVNRRFAKPGETNSADFLPVVAWRQQAEFITKYFRKGSSICVVGSLQSRTWNDNQGNKRYAYEVVVDEASFVDSKTDNARVPTAAEFGEAPPMPSYSSQPSEPVNFEELQDDDDLPF